MPSTLSSSPNAALYLDLMARVVTRYGFEGRTSPVTFKAHSYEASLWRLVRSTLDDRDVRMIEEGTIDAARRADGRDPAPDAETQVGLRRLAHTRSCVEQVVADAVPGDLVESGAGRGGGAVYLRAVLRAHAVTDRTVWVTDAEPDVADAFGRYDLLDDQVRIVDQPGAVDAEQVSVLRIGESADAATALETLYDRVAPGGFVVVDAYGADPACARAVDDVRSARGIDDPIETVDWSGAFWRKA